MQPDSGMTVLAEEIPPSQHVDDYIGRARLGKAA
jgi:hypothetical protein